MALNWIGGGAGRRSNGKCRVKEGPLRADGARVDSAGCAEIGVPTQSFIRVMCPNLGCQRILAVPVVARGKIVRCGACGVNVRIPAAKPADGPARDGDKGQPA